MPFNVGPVELILVLAIALILFGPGKLPEIGRSLGSSIREFRKAASDLQEPVTAGARTAPPAPTAPAPAVAAQPAPASPAVPVQPVASAEQPATRASRADLGTPDADGPGVGA